MKTIFRMRDQLEYIRRHYRTTLRHMTPKKVLNALYNDMELRMGKTTLKSKPLFIKVEPTPNCHLKCAGCYCHGPNQPEDKYPKGARMTGDEFAKIIDPIKDTLIGISLSLRGDSLHSPTVYDMISYCRDNNIGTVFPSNFSYKFNDAQLEKLVDSGLDHLMISIDGTTQEAYEKYRCGGNLEWVMDNARRLLEIKRRKNSWHPLVEWKFVIFNHNKHQVEEARAMAKEMGFDRFSTVLDYAEQHKQDKNKAEQKKDLLPKGTSCYWSYKTTVVCWDGNVLPCCDERFSMGNALESGFMNVWNGHEYRELRRMFKTGLSTTDNCRLCENCPMYWNSVLQHGSIVQLPVSETDGSK